MADILPLTTGSTAAPVPGIVGASYALAELLVLADRAAAGEATVLLSGESGTGKDLFARYIHARSQRATRPFITVNCAAIKDPFLESECFGHVKGSFPGAQRDTPGKLELADAGTLLLDEISCASLRMQVLLLRFLETGEVHAIGPSRPPRRTDVRVIATTTANLTNLARSGAFREDLLYRLRVAHLHVPPLRERPADIAPLVAHTIARTGRAVRFSEQALALLAAYHWPGNVRELHAVVEHLVWMSGAAVIDVPHLPATLRTTGHRVVSMVERRRQLADDLYAALSAHTLSFWEGLYPLFLSRDVTRHDLRELMRRGLRATSGSYRALVPLFGMDPRDYKRLLNFLAAHDCNIDPRPFRKGADQTAVPVSDVRMAAIGSGRKPPETRRERSSAQP